MFWEGFWSAWLIQVFLMLAMGFILSLRTDASEVMAIGFPISESCPCQRMRSYVGSRRVLLMSVNLSDLADVMREAVLV